MKPLYTFQSSKMQKNEVKSIHSFFFILMLFCLSSLITNATIRYVKPTATGAGDGSSWANASADLQAMIDASVANDEIWVATGTYLPTKDPFGNSSPTNPRDKTFYLKNQVKLYGGFEGTETLLSQRTTAVIAANPSILSGDINNSATTDDDAYHIVLSVLDDNTTVFNGFTITKSNASNNSSITVETNTINRFEGAGMYSVSSAIAVSNCTFTTNTAPTGKGGGMANYNSTSIISNCIFDNNSSYIGGGMYNNNCILTINNCSFTNNYAGANGGGLYNENITVSSPITTISNCLFNSNSSYSNGGGLFITYSGSPIISNCIISNNTAQHGKGGGMFTGYIYNGTYWPIYGPILTNCTFKSNSGAYGGGIYASITSLDMTNCSFIANNATYQGGYGGGIFNYYSLTNINNCSFCLNNAFLAKKGGGIYNFGGSLGDVMTIKNTIFWHNGIQSIATLVGADIFNDLGSWGKATLTNTALQLDNNLTNYPANGTSSGFQGSGTGNIYAIDPLFTSEIDFDGADNVFGTADDGLTLQNCSPAINAGNNADIPVGISTDITGAARIRRSIVDMGAYENQNGTMSVSISANLNTAFCAGTSVKITATPTNVGASPIYNFKVNGTSMQNSAATTYTTTTLANGDVVSVELTSVSCIVTSNTIPMTVYSLPIPTAGSNSPTCAGNTLNISSSGGISYAWTGPNSYSSTDQNPSFINASTSLSGTYIVTVTNANGCSATTSAAVTVNALPTPTAGNNSPICAGNTLNLTSSGGNSYAWTGPNSYSSTIQNPSFNNAGTSLSGTYSVTVTNISGCTATTSTAVTVNALPTPTAGSNSPICAGNTLNLTSSGGNSYAWIGPNGYSSTTQNPNLINTTTSFSGTYIVTATNANGCTATASVLVEVNQLAPNISANPTTVNFGENSTLTATGCSGTIQWSVAGLTTNPLIIKLDNTTAFTATCTVNGCTSISSNVVTVTVNNNPCQNQVTLVSVTDDYSSGVYQKMASSTNGKITATNKITDTSQVIYKAKAIELNAGFKADSGTVFLAMVGGCN